MKAVYDETIAKKIAEHLAFEAVVPISGTPRTAYEYNAIRALKGIALGAIKMYCRLATSESNDE